MTIRETTSLEATLAVVPAPGRRGGRRAVRATLLTSAVVTGLCALTACGGGSSSASSPASAPAASIAASATTAADGASDDAGVPTAPAARSGSVPTPEGDTRKTLVYILQALDTKMNQDPDTLVKKSVDLCRQMLAGDKGKKLDADTSKEFTNGSWVPQGEEVTALELAMTQTFCR